MKPKSIGIVGGTGRMGQWLKRFLEESGYQVMVSGRKTEVSSKELASLCDVVIVSVPIKDTAKVIKEIGPYVRPDTLLMDITSIKKEPVEAMLAYSRSEVIGTHPLFGPSAPSIKGQIVVVCPARTKIWLPWLKELLLSHKAKITVSTPKKHDEIMTIVQGLSYFFVLATGVAIRESPFNLNEFLDYSTPFFRIILRKMHSMKQSPEMFASIQFHNYHSIPKFLEIVNELKEVIEDQDYQKFYQIFQRLNEIPFPEE